MLLEDATNPISVDHHPRLPFCWVGSMYRFNRLHLVLGSLSTNPCSFVAPHTANRRDSVAGCEGGVLGLSFRYEKRGFTHKENWCELWVQIPTRSWFLLILLYGGDIMTGFD